MILRSGGICSFMVCVVLAVLLTASVADGADSLVVSADLNGAANYMVSNGDGTFSSQPSPQGLESASAGGTGGISYGNGLGDFDNDGDLDYIVGSGTWGGGFYLFENLGPGNQFKAPVMVDSWGFTQGFYVMDMAVADFNGDGNLDFVVSFDFSQTCSLYLGDGSLNFTHHPLDATAPLTSTGADAADFNNDGNADFVVAPGSYDFEVYVNLGKGDGTFDTLIFYSNNYSYYDGIAAADFNNDGNVDLAAASSLGYLDIYMGQGTGTFGPGQHYGGEGHSNSTLDNGDFDGDGDQDLVSGGLGVNVFSGNGDGTFSLPNTSGESNGRLWSTVTAAPFLANKEPVAAVDAAYPDVSVGEALEFSGSGSSDEDGQIGSYTWEFGDGSTGAGEIVQHTYNDVGVYTVTLTVTDNQGAADSATTEVTVVEAIAVPPKTVEMPPIDAKIKFHHGELNLKGKGKGNKQKWIEAKIKLPKGYDARNIDLSTVCIFSATDDAVVEFAYIDPKHELNAQKTRKRHKPKTHLSVKFDRQAVRDLIIKNPSKKMTMMVEGYMTHNGESLKFSGSSKLKIKMKRGR